MLEDRLKEEEGFRAKPYFDSVGKLTIGWGRNLIDDPLTGQERDYLGVSPDFPVEDLKIDQEQAEYLLRNDIGKTREEVRKRLPWVIQLDPVRQDVLYDMAFNMGVHGLLGFHHTLAFVQAGNYGAASEAILESKAARELPSRYALLAHIMKTGEDLS
jgi:lysozyme